MLKLTFSVFKGPLSVLKDRFPVSEVPFPVLKSPFSVLKLPFSVLKGTFSVLKGPLPVLKGPLPVLKGPFPVLKVRFSVTEFSFNSDFKLKEDFCLQASVAFHIQFIAFCCLDNSCILKHNFNMKKLLISHMNNCKFTRLIADGFIGEM